jgi:hypothetical protein
MNTNHILILLLLAILIASIITVALLLKINSQGKIKPRQREILNQLLLNKPLENSLLIDPQEEKLLTALLNSKNNGISVDDLNSLLNLQNLSKENQRQRRHIIIKELNLKLFLLLGVRESITRKSEFPDKRIKTYSIDSELLNLNKIQKLLTDLIG